MNQHLQILRGERGGAPTLMVFAIFIVISSSIAIAYLQTTESRSISAIQQRTAADVTQATASGVDAELTKALETATTAAEYEIGMAGGTLEEVKNRIKDYLNNRIAQGWSQSNMDITMPLVGENDLSFEWQPNGSLIVRGYLDAKFEHVMSPTAYGLDLRASPYPRFQRIKHVTELIDNMISPGSDLSALEAEANENYACEGLSIDITEEDGQAVVSVTDAYGARGVILGD